MTRRSFMQSLAAAVAALALQFKGREELGLAPAPAPAAPEFILERLPEVTVTTLSAHCPMVGDVLRFGRESYVVTNTARSASENIVSYDLTLIGLVPRELIE